MWTIAGRSSRKRRDSAGYQAGEMAGPLVQLDEPHVVGPEAAAELRGDRRQCDDRVPPALRGKAIDEVHHSVLEPADGEAEDDVRDQRALTLHHPSPRDAARASASSMAGPISRAKLSSAAVASPGASRNGA